MDLTHLFWDEDTRWVLRRQTGQTACHLFKRRHPETALHMTFRVAGRLQIVSSYQEGFLTGGLMLLFGLLGLDFSRR